MVIGDTHIHAENTTPESYVLQSYFARMVEEGCDAVVGILAPKEVRIRRIMAREGISEDYARRRVEAQQGDGFFRAHCGYILENREDDTPEAFRARARALFEQILQI